LLLPLLLQLALIILAARAFAIVFRKLMQPSVVGEIAAGLVLGPSVFGRFFPGLFAAIFHPRLAGLPPDLSNPMLAWILTTFSQVGLILLLLLIGLECDFSHLRRHGPSALAIALAGLALPVALGSGLALVMRPSLGVLPDNAFCMLILMALATTVMTTPILLRLMRGTELEPHILRSGFVSPPATGEGPGSRVLPDGHEEAG
jgi:Kef-type K+ transport system membrane component KefB